MTRFADDLGYARCPVCEEQIPASLYCEDCNAYAWEHPPAVPHEEWKARQVPLAELKRTGTGGYWS